MAVQAKVAPIDQQVAQATERTVSNTLPLSQSSNVALNIPPESVASYNREGMDLVVQMQDGEVLRITNFYSPVEQPSQLFLVGEEEQLIAVDLSQAASDGILAASYASETTLSGFTSLTSAAATTGGTLGLGTAAIIGGVAIAGGVVVADEISSRNDDSNDSGGGGSGGGENPVDITPPAAATNLLLSQDSRFLTGSAEPGATVRVDVNGTLYSVTVDPAGNFIVPFPSALTNGENIRVEVVDAAGNVSPPADITAPAVMPSSVEQVNGDDLTGVSAPYATIIMMRPNGEELGRTTADVNGNWSYGPIPWADGSVIDVQAVLANGFRPPVIRIVIDRTPPDAPTVEASNGTLLSGMAEPNSTLTLTFDNGTSVNVNTNANGMWNYSPTPALADGAQVEIVATDRAGNVSDATTLTVDAQAPGAPTIDNSNGIVFSGTAEIGSTVILSGTNGPIGQALVDANGNWHFTASPAVANGSQVSVVARDAAGNTGLPDSVVVNNALPNAPTIAASNGTVISGTATPGSTVVVTNSNGIEIGRDTADGNGAWSITPTAPLRPGDGDVIKAVVETPQGTSASATLTIDAAPPQQPVVQPSNGSELAGTAEAGGKIILIYSNGQLIGQTTADADGNWSFIPTTPLDHLDSIDISVRDAVGNTSPPVTVVIDRDPPPAPVISPSNGVTISGTAEPGSTVVITGPGGVIIGEVIATNGTWSFTPTLPISHDTPLSVTARDAAGNLSAPGTITVDAEPPAAPTLDPTRGTLLSGTAEPGSTVLISLDGAVAVPVPVDGDGNWSYSPATQLANGTVIRVIAEDPSGNASTPVTGAVDRVAPGTPTVAPSNGSLLSGTAEPGSTITVSLPDGSQQTTTTATDGTWALSPATPLSNGSTVSVIATDAAGNPSPAASQTIDTTLPPRPTIDPSNGSQFSGTATAGASVVLTGPGGSIGQTTADSNGNWTISVSPQLANNTSVSATVVANGLSSAPAITVTDSVAPLAPTLLPSNGSLLSGSAEAGSTVTLTGPGGVSIGQATANAQGVWTFQPAPPVANGTLVSATARDAAGNQSPAVSTTIDNTAPQIPTVQPSNGTLLTGTAEAGSTVIISDASGRVIGQVMADSGGNWTLAPSPALADNATINVVARDAAGNSSAPAGIVIDAAPPSAPIIEPSNGIVLRGSAEPGSKIILRDADGNVIAETTAAANGAWSTTLTAQLPNGTQVIAVATDVTGNASPPASITVDGLAPAAPTITPSNGSQLSGSAEAGSTVILTGPGGVIIGQVTAGASGIWTFTPTNALANGTQVSVVARDAAGNTSPTSSVTIDNLPPSSPTIVPSNGTQLSGVGEVGSTLIISAGGTVIGQAVVAADGTWSFTPPNALTHGTPVSITARDATGNQSTPVSITIDAQAPNPPVIQPSNGSLLNGTAEAGSTVILTGPGGVAIGQTTADANGNWTFTAQNPLLDGTQVTVVARDNAGNTSQPATTIIDATAPAVPTITASSGSGFLTGTADPGSTVLLSIGNAAPVTVQVDNSGTWSYPINGQLAHQTQVSVVARDSVGNTSPGASITIDAQAPNAPVVNPSNGVQINGTAEANSFVTVSGPNGFSQTLQADANGNWSITPASALPNGALLTVTATDAVGNQSAASTVRVDATLPPRPSIAPSDGNELSGTALPGTTVLLTDAAGTPIGQAPVDGQGNWVFTPTTPLANGTTVNATINVGGISSTPATTVVDSVAPNTPTINASNGAQLSGNAEAGATVILTGSGGVSIGQAVADATGNWTFTPDTALANGTVVTAVARDAAGNTSGQAATAIDALAPATPTINASNGVQLGGSADAGSTVVITDASGRIIGQVTATAEGTWTLTPSPALPNGAVISAVARDALGNTSAAVSTTIDTVAPVAPTISPSNGIELSGTAEAGSTVIITGAGGSPIGQTTANAGGIWSFTPTTAVPNGTQVSVVSRDAAGNTSPSASTVIDSQVPDHPTVNPSNGLLLSGTAEIGSTVIITGAGVIPSVTVNVDANGNWSFAPAQALANGSLVTIVARDALGNESAPASILIDSVAPSAPLINPSNGQIISGTAEAGSTVNIRVNGSSIGTTEVDANGNWTFTATPPLGNTTQISATATDAAGNVSLVAEAIVDALAPATPGINSSNGVVLSGTAEVGTTVIITGAGGAAIDQAIVDGAGNWSFVPPVALTNNTQVTVVVRDAAGNTSPSANLVIDTVAPIAPTVQPSNGISLTGSAEAGSTVILTGPGGVIIGQATAGPGGDWNFSPQPPLQHGALISISARDAAGNTGASASITIDAIAPATPTIAATNGALLQGTAEAGSTLTLKVDGNTLTTLIVGASGTWSFAPSTTQPNGALVSVESRDAAGNLSASASTRVDSIPPPPPFIAASNGADLSGTAEAGSTVRLSVGGLQIAQVTADANGNWHFTSTPALPDNTLVTAIAVDAAGNTSGPASVTVDDSGPDLPVVAPSNGSLISGIAEPGSTVTIRIAGQPDVQVTADPISGAWSSTFLPALANGTSVSVTATDATNNVSAPAVIVIDSMPPAVPTIQASNGTLLTGTAEAGSTVILTGTGGVQIGTTTANASGSWSLNLGTPLANGTVVTVVARDAASNISPSATTTIDNIAPNAPTIVASNGTQLSGSAEAGSTVILTGTGGVQIGIATADSNGAWAFSPSPALANGVVVTAIARDAAGNNSGSVSTTIDAVAPVAPTIQPSNGTLLTGTAEAGSTVTLTGVNGTLIGTVVTGTNGVWTLSSPPNLANGTVVNAVAQDAAGNTSLPVSTTIDKVAPNTPSISISNGTVLTGTAEAGSTVIITGPGGAAIGQTTANASGAWSFTPGTPLAHNTAVTVVAKDAAGNTSTSATTNIDSQAPSAPSNLFVTADGTLLTGNAEPNSQVRIVVNGNVANPITVTATAAGTFAAVLIPALVAGQPIGVTSIDAAGNVSVSASTNAPNLSAPTISVPEAADTYINAAEAADGIQVRVGLATGVRAGDVVTVTYTGTGGYQFNQAHTVTAAEALAGSAVVSVVPPSGSFPQGAASVTAHINNGANSQAANFTVDTIPPSSPVLGLVGNLLTISGEPNSELTIRIDLGGTVATATVTANNAGLASLNLLTGLNIGLSYDQLLSAQVSVSAKDQAGNQSNVATLGLGTSLQQQPITLGNLAVDANLNLLNLPAARLGISGKTVAGAALAVEVLTPLGYIGIAPLAADANGNFSVNLLSPTVLSQLGLSLTNILNLGGDLALRITATSAGKTSGVYTVDLDPLGLLGLTIGNVRVDGTAADDILSGNATIAGERIFAGAGNDLILNVGSGDRVDAGAGNDTIQIKATNFGNVDGGTGFDTVVFDGGIDINYGAAGIGTFSNIERIDLGTGDSGSTLTLTAAAVDAMTDSRNTLQITGESNDVLNLTASALKTGAQQIDGITYDVYTYGSTTLLVEENTVQVVVS
ncbi:BapA prefix-like domain-containing protein [Pseudomonas sp. MM211]|uniref:Ig-like domain-containing protein n=1 Tax=Pseudomonas sp. MM211 TaxID=2866808 RepID=UPI001CEC10AE|nr:Ig-like domain-containing protein [Pseudomonas sp. MM211]UCJ17666.1 BapA prefix-like domain-containing protein [Pseudomonas sp. MM211]